MPPPLRPPALARVVLLTLTPACYRKELDGDLLEGFSIRRQTLGAVRARLWYWRQLFSMDVIGLWWLRRPRHRTGSPVPPKNAAVLDGCRQDLRYALRSLAKRPGYASVIIVTLALGIGANTAIFSIVNGVLLRPLPYEAPEQLTMIFRTVPRFGFTRSTASYPDFADWRAQSRSFASLAASRSTNLTYLAADGAERWRGYGVTANLTRTLGVAPLLGRTMNDDDDRAGAVPVILLSYQNWRTRFAGDTGVLGTTLTLDGDPVTVIGVMPAGFAFPASADFWVPLQGEANGYERDSNFLSVIGRLAPGVSLDQARTEMEALAGRIDREAPDANDGYGIFLEARHEFVVRNARTALFVFLGAVSLVLLVACANVANVTLARAATRGRELAIRIAHGASRSRLVRQLLIESSVLSVAGGILGLGVAVGLLQIMVTLGRGQLPRMAEVGIDPVVLAFMMVMSLGCGIASGIAPALVGSRTEVNPALKEAGRATGLGRLGHRLQESFVVVQIALAIILSVGAGLLTQSFLRLTSVDTGFEASSVVVARVAPVRPRMEMSAGMSDGGGTAQPLPRTRRRDQFFDALTRRVAPLPGVRSVGLGYALPFSGYYFSRGVTSEGDELPAGDVPTISGNIIGGDYLEAMGIPLLAGRVFGGADHADAEPVVIVNQTLAGLFWDGEDAVGNRMRFADSQGSWMTVVGVVGDVRQRSLAEVPRPIYYRPFVQATWPDAMYVVARSTVPAAELVPQIRREVWALDPALPVTDVATAAALLASSVAEDRFRTAVVFTFGAFAVVLVLVGIYGVMTFTVGERTREIGVRMALGAGQGRILRMILGRGIRLTAIGVTLGIAGGLVSSRFLVSMLFGVTPHDGPTFLAAALMLVVLSAIACLLPARRAAKVDPLSSLRCE